MASHGLLTLAALLVILALSGSLTKAQTTDTITGATAGTTGVTTEDWQAVTEVVTETFTEVVEEEWQDPCDDNPCSGTANTECVSSEESYTCECLNGYSLSGGNCTAVQAFSGQFEITQIGDSAATYTEALGDTASTEFKELAADVEDMIDTVYLASSLASVYMGSTVTGFSSGSLNVDYTVSFAQEDTSGGGSTPVTLSTTAVATAFTTSLAEQVTAGSLSMTVDEHSVVIEDFDECASPDDNYCHENADCTNTVGSFSCACGDDFVDVSPDLPNNPGRVCDTPPSMAPNLACLSNPCTDPTMVCEPNDTSSTGYECVCIPGYKKDAYWSCEPIERKTNFRCYSCQDSYDIVECNGRQKSENGSYEWCPNPTDTCYTTIQMNPEGDGWLTRKGCMDKEECYDIMYGYKADPEKDSCYTYIWPYGPNTPPKGGLQCHYCCNERWGLDLCNIGITAVLYTMPFVNSWDPRMNWDLTLDLEEPAVPESAAILHLPYGPAALILTVTLAYILH